MDFLPVTNFQQLEKLVSEGSTETLTLEFKGSASLSRDSANVNELCKDISAFANSAGGQIVYGVAEDKKTKTFSIDEGLSDEKITREWLDQIISSKIQPRIAGVQIQEIKLKSGRAIVIDIPPTQTGPHQAPDLKYYRRFETQSVPMHDYEIRDVARRSSSPVLEVKLQFETGRKITVQQDAGKERPDPISLQFTITNSSTPPALYTSLVIGLDTRLGVLHASNLQSLGQWLDGDKHLGWYRRELAVPKEMPIFREGGYGQDDATLSIFLGHIRSIFQFDVRVIVQTPGFYKKSDWIIHQIAQNVELEPDPDAN